MTVVKKVFEKGMTVKVNGIPFVLAEDALVEGEEGNFDLALGGTSECKSSNTRKVLEAARHELSFIGGLVATDRHDVIETIPADSRITLDTREVIALIDKELNQFSGTGSLPS